MKFTIAVMAALFSMYGPGALIFSIMILWVCGIVEVMHHKTMLDIRFKRWASDKKRYFVSEKIEVANK